MRPGFTLLEVLVGLTVSAVAVTIGFHALAFLRDSTVALHAHERDNARSMNARRTLLDVVEGAHLTADRTGPSFQALDGVREEFNDDQATFLTTAASPFGYQDAIVRLYIDRDDETPERGLVVELTEWRGDGRRTVELEPNAAGLSLRFLSDVMGEDRWYPSWVSTSVLPAAVELAIQPAPGAELDPLLQLPILVPIQTAR